MRARREHSGTRAGRSWTQPAATRPPATARLAALCQAGGVRWVAGRGASVRAGAGTDGATARHVSPVTCCCRRHRRRTQNGVRGVSAAAGGAAVELLGRRGRTPLRTRHAHGYKRGSVYICDHVGGCDACAERGVCAGRPAGLPVHLQPTAWYVNVGAVRVGRLRRGRVRRATGAALPGRARARAGRARSHEPPQQPRRQEDSERPGAPRVQVSRRVGLVCGAHVLARAAAVPRRGGRAARPLRPRQARRAAPAICAATTAASHAPRARAETEAEPGRGAGAAQVGPRVPGAVALVLRARRRGGVIRDTLASLQQNLQRRRRVRVAVLRARVQHGAARAGVQVSLSLPLVLPRHLRHVRRAHRDTRLQLTID